MFISLKLFKALIKSLNFQLFLNEIKLIFMIIAIFGIKVGKLIGYW
jgi:hypothetical protein